MELKKLTYKNKRALNCKLSKFLSLRLLRSGQITSTHKIWVNCLGELKKALPLKNKNFLILSILKTLGPQVDQRKLRVGQNTIEVPFPVTKNRKIFLCFKWFLDQAAQRKKQDHIRTAKALADAFYSVIKEKGDIVQKKKNWQSQAYKNIRFLRYRWS